MNIKSIGTVIKSFKPQTVSENSKELFSFATKHRFKTPNGKLSEDGMILTHMSNFAPNHGFIETARSGGGYARDSVHFAVNHGVQGHFGGNWDQSKYAVLIPMNAARQTAGNKFVGGVGVDFYSKGRVKIPKGSILVRQTSNVPKGQYRISDASKIEEFKELHGVKLIETSSTNMRSTVDNIIHRLGYETKSGDAIMWGDIFSDYNAFNSFLRKNGMKPMIHTYTPNAKVEEMLNNLKARVINNAEWIVKDKTGNTIIDYQKEYLQGLKYIDKFAEETGYPKDFDTKQIAQIIKRAQTPKEALDLIERKFKIRAFQPKMKLSELKLFEHYQVHVNSNSLQTTDNILFNHLKKANNKTMWDAVLVPAGGDTRPDVYLSNKSRENINKIYKRYHLNFDNTIANKLYELG